MTRILIVAAVVLFLTVPSLSRASQSDPSLPETIDWLTRAIEENVVDAYSTDPRSLNASPVSRDWKLAKSQGCQITLSTPPVSGAERTLGYFRDQTSITFSFENINPTSVSVEQVRSRVLDGTGRGIEPIGGAINSEPPNLWAVSLRATDSAKLIRWQIGKNKFEFNNLRIVVERQEMARRLLNAVKRATTLCGGKPDKKEPF